MGQPVALLWDLDNVAVTKQHLVPLAISMREACGTEAVLFAAGHRRVARVQGPALEALGFSVLSGGRARNGADRALLRAHRRLCDQGVARFAVASSDHAFAALALRSHTTVFTLDPTRVAMRLMRSARGVVVFYSVGGLFVPSERTSLRREPPSPIGRL